MTDERKIMVRVNGETTVCNVNPDLFLIDLLRDDLGLTGTKKSCEMQVCGACSVLVNDEPVSSCMYLACDVDGAEITTVEGLASGGELGALQQAFIARSAFQCGFCTSGFLVMATALLSERPQATRDEIVEYLDGNICRCTGYDSIIEAISQVAEENQSRDTAGVPE